MLPIPRPLISACQVLTRKASMEERAGSPRPSPLARLVGADQLAVPPDSQEAAVAPEGLVVVLGVRPRLHLGRGLGEVAYLLDGVPDLLRVRPHPVERTEEEAGAVIRLGGGHRVEVAALILEALLHLGVQRLGVVAVVGT